ncbi:acid-sensing ion channel 4-like [Pollicipes pollicipes]|uniref:acid-sensing ion channel 4-like n=1 Tax=Pollicipes pollicipes TaxID=41117 RepID=UPI001884E11E|nr:acid-sensing ion channel 4-like [Pollicipes pollicipes]
MDSSPLRTVFYAAMLTGCAVVCLLQCVTQFNLYWSEPAAMTVTIQKGERVLFPAFTVCSSRKFSRSRVQAMGLLNKRGTNVDWNRFPANESVEAFWLEAPAGRWTPVIARNGMCYTFTPNTTLVVKNEEKLDITFNLYINDYFNKFSSIFVDVYFHGNEPPIMQSRYFNVADHPKVKLFPGDISNVDVTGRSAVFKSLKRRPCQPQRGYTETKCTERCMWQHETGQVGCRAPWMAGLTSAPPLCSTPRDLMDMQSPPAVKRGSVACPHCEPSCCTEMYQVQVSSSQHAAGMANRGTCKMLARWPYQMELSTEELTYGLSGLISDVGGNMSLLLGVSVISIVQASEMLLKVMRQRLQALHMACLTRVAPPSCPKKKPASPTRDVAGVPVTPAGWPALKTAKVPGSARYQSPAA